MSGAYDQQDPWNEEPVGEEIDSPQVDEASEAGAQQGGNDALAKLQAERDELFERLARVTAEFRNSQRRLEQEKDQAVAYANSSLLKSLLPVIDNLERALAVDVSKTDVTQLLKGMQIVLDQWLNVLKTQQVEPIAPQKGTPFDPNLHEALMQQPSAEYAEPTVTQLLQKGYTHKGRTIRPAGVAVSTAG